MLTRSITVNPNTMKRNCSSPGTRFDFSLKSTSNTTMYNIVPAASPKINIPFRYIYAFKMFWLIKINQLTTS